MKSSKQRMYPDDGGLKKPVRSYDSTFSAVTLLMTMFSDKLKNENDKK